MKKLSFILIGAASMVLLILISQINDVLETHKTSNVQVVRLEEPKQIQLLPQLQSIPDYQDDSDYSFVVMDNGNSINLYDGNRFVANVKIKKTSLQRVIFRDNR